MPLAPGSIIDEKYQILSVLGAGGMGAVYKANQLQLDRVVALKVLTESLTDEVNVKRFQMEALAISSLKHRNIVMFYGYGIWQTCPYFVMEYLTGQSLSTLIEQNGRLLATEALDIIRQVAEGLSCAHANSIVHRDLKPSNVMLVDVDGSRVPKIIDFGLIRVLSQSATSQQRLTEAGSTVGSALYMSPEQCCGLDVDPRSDIYALGCLLHHCVTGVAPFVAEHPFTVMQRHVSDVFPSVLDDCADAALPQGLQELIFNATAKDPRIRYQNVAEFLRDLDAVATGRGADVSCSRVRSVPVSVAGSHAQARISKSGVAFLASLVVIALVSAVFFGFGNHKPALEGKNSISYFNRANDLSGANVTPAEASKAADWCFAALEKDKTDHLLETSAKLRLYYRLSDLLQRSKRFADLQKVCYESLRYHQREHIDLQQNSIGPFLATENFASQLHCRWKSIDMLNQVLKLRVADENTRNESEMLRLGLANLYEELGDTDKALKYLTGLGTNHDDSFAYVRNIELTKCYLRKHRCAEALDLALKSASQFNPESPRYDLAILARAYICSGEFDKAERALEQLAKERYDKWSAAGITMLLAAHRGNWKAAELQAQSILDWAERDPSSYFLRLEDWDLDEYAKALQANGASALARKIQEARARCARLAVENN